MVVGKRQRSAQGVGRLALLSVSAIVLALVLFPTLAQAECTSSSCIEYTESLPEAGGGNSNHHKQNPAKVSKSGKDGGSSQTGSKEQDSKETGSEGESSQQSGATPGGGEGGPSQGSGGGSHQGGSGHEKQAGKQSASNAPASESSGGGSSPLVPILIAIAALAALSLGAVLYRKRRQSGGPSASASPEAS